MLSNVKNSNLVSFICLQICSFLSSYPQTKNHLYFFSFSHSTLQITKSWCFDSSCCGLPSPVLRFRCLHPAEPQQHMPYQKHWTDTGKHFSLTAALLVGSCARYQPKRDCGARSWCGVDDIGKTLTLIDLAYPCSVFRGLLAFQSTG